MNATELATLRDRVSRARIEREAHRHAPPPRPRNPVGPRVRFASEEERQEARRRSSNASKKRLYGVCPKCGGGKAATPKVKVCRSCWSRTRLGEIAA